MPYHPLAIAANDRDLSTHYIELDGSNMTPSLAVGLGQPNAYIVLPEEAMKKVKAARQIVDEIVTKKTPTYGVNSGFGIFYKQLVTDEKLPQLQENLILSHAAGFGDPLPNTIARTMVALRIHTLLRAHSGIRPETIERMTELYNLGIVPEIPKLGSVGASGDLIPLAHMAAAYCYGKGKLWNPKTQSYENAKKVLESFGYSSTFPLAAKEGLALINGTQYITAVGAHALERAQSGFKNSHVISALSLVGIQGHRDTFRPEANDVKPHKDQIAVAAAMMQLTAPGIIEAAGVPQDPYSYRCIPQVIGTSQLELRTAIEMLSQEMNGSSDNPLVIEQQRKLLSAGNFHGQFAADAMDIASLAVKHLNDMSREQLNRLVDGGSGLPTYLTLYPGICSGTMMYETAASSLNVPINMESAQSYPAGRQEDQNSRGPHAARQTLAYTEILEYSHALQLICAVRAIQIREARKEEVIIPKLLGPLYEQLKDIFGPLPEKDTDTYEKDNIDKALAFIRSHRLEQTYDHAAGPNTHLLDPTTKQPACLRSKL